MTDGQHLDIGVFTMFEDELLAISENISLMPEGERIVFYELKKKSKTIGFLLAILLFGGAGQIYATRVKKGITSVLLTWLILLFIYLLRDSNGWSLLRWFGCISLILLYIYAVWDTGRMIDEYNENLYLAVFGSYEQ